MTGEGAKKFLFDVIFLSWADIKGISDFQYLCVYGYWNSVWQQRTVVEMPWGGLPSVSA
jgi:hypothetical protein